MSCCKVGMGGWVGGWVFYLGEGLGEDGFFEAHPLKIAFCHDGTGQVEPTRVLAAV